MAGQVWGTDSKGGYMYSDQLSKLLRTAVQPMTRFRQFADAKDATQKGLHEGDIFNWNIFSDVETAGAKLTETAAMPETNFTITQGTLTVYEYGNSVPYTGVLDDNSEQPVEEIIKKVLKNDANKALDAATHVEFAKTKYTACPANASTDGDSPTAVEFTTTGTPGQKNNYALTDDHVKAIVDWMKERDIPVYDGRDYFALARPSTWRRLKNDLEAIHSYVDQGFGMIMNGEVGRHYEGVRFIEQTGIASQSWANGLSDQAFFFGEDTVAEALVVPEEIRGKIPTDFGRSKGVAWYALLGYGLVHSGTTNARIVEWGSTS